MTHAVVGFGDRVQRAAAGERADKRRLPTRLAEQAEHEAGTAQRQSADDRQQRHRGSQARHEGRHCGPRHQRKLVQDPEDSLGVLHVPARYPAHQGFACNVEVLVAHAEDRSQRQQHGVRAPGGGHHQDEGEEERNAAEQLGKHVDRATPEPIDHVAGQRETAQACQPFDGKGRPRPGCIMRGEVDQERDGVQGELVPQLPDEASCEESSQLCRSCSNSAW